MEKITRLFNVDLGGTYYASVMVQPRRLLHSGTVYAFMYSFATFPMNPAASFNRSKLASAIYILGTKTNEER